MKCAYISAQEARMATMEPDEYDRLEPIAAEGAFQWPS